MNGWMECYDMLMKIVYTSLRLTPSCKVRPYTLFHHFFSFSTMLWGPIKVEQKCVGYLKCGFYAIICFCWLVSPYHRRLLLWTVCLDTLEFTPQMASFQSGCLHSEHGLICTHPCTIVCLGLASGQKALGIETLKLWPRYLNKEVMNYLFPLAFFLQCLNHKNKWSF